ncbi:MAG: motility-associated protein [Limisphaerales bacterium]
MIIIIGAIVVIVCVFGGFMLEGGELGVILHAAINEVLIIAGGAAGSLIIMSPKKILMDIVKGVIVCLKGAPHNRASYDDLLKVLYELFLLGRRNGMIALEEHVTEPESSSIFKKYPRFTANHHAVEFLCGALRPTVNLKGPLIINRHTLAGKQVILANANATDYSVQHPLPVAEETA